MQMMYALRKQSRSNMAFVGVPYFVINQKYAISGAQATETFVNALNVVWQEEFSAPKFQDLSAEGVEDASCMDGNCENQIGSRKSDKKILTGIGAMHIIKKGQLHQQVKSIQNQLEFTHKLFVNSFMIEKKVIQPASIFPKISFCIRTVIPGCYLGLPRVH